MNLMRKSKKFHLLWWILAILIGLFAAFVLIIDVSDSPKEIPAGAVLKGSSKEQYWIYEVHTNDSNIMHLQIFNTYNGEMALEADFERQGINTIDSICYFEPYRIVLKNGCVCHLIKKHKGYL